eukprot:508039-Pelagomonas_calceolata.AAC.5
MGEGKFSMGRQPAPRPSVRAAAGNSKANGTRGSSQQQQQQQQGAGVRTGTSSFAFMGTNAHVVSCVVQPNAAKASTPSAVASAQGGRMTTTQISTTGVHTCSCRFSTITASTESCQTETQNTATLMTGLGQYRLPFNYPLWNSLLRPPVASQTPVGSTQSQLASTLRLCWALYTA